MRDIIKKTHGFNFGGTGFHSKQQEQQKRVDEAKEMVTTKPSLPLIPSSLCCGLSGEASEACERVDNVPRFRTTTHTQAREEERGCNTDAS